MRENENFVTNKVTLKQWLKEVSKQKGSNNRDMWGRKKEGGKQKYG